MTAQRIYARVINNLVYERRYYLRTQYLRKIKMQGRLVIYSQSHVRM